jgi:hypothetical protein
VRVFAVALTRNAYGARLGRQIKLRLKLEHENSALSKTEIESKLGKQTLTATKITWMPKGDAGDQGSTVIKGGMSAASLGLLCQPPTQVLMCACSSSLLTASFTAQDCATLIMRGVY